MGRNSRVTVFAAIGSWVGSASSRSKTRATELPARSSSVVSTTRAYGCVAPLRRRRERPRSLAVGDHDPARDAAPPSASTTARQRWSSAWSRGRSKRTTSGSRVPDRRRLDAPTPRVRCDGGRRRRRGSAARTPSASGRPCASAKPASTTTSIGRPLTQWVAGFAMRREASLDTRRVEEHRDARSFGVPELGLHREERSGQRFARCRRRRRARARRRSLRSSASRSGDRSGADCAGPPPRSGGSRPRTPPALVTSSRARVMREGIEVVELERRGRLDERMMDEHRVRRARHEGIRRYEAERVAVDLVLPVDRREVARAQRRLHELGGIDGYVSRAFTRRHGRHARRARARGQPVSRRQSTPR